MAEMVWVVMMPSIPAFSSASSRFSMNSFQASASSSSPSRRAEDASEKALSACARASSSCCRASARLVSSVMPSIMPPGRMPRLSLSSMVSMLAMPASNWVTALWAWAYCAFSVSLSEISR